jgi:hypothetical protein
VLGNICRDWYRTRHTTTDSITYQKDDPSVEAEISTMQEIPTACQVYDLPFYRSSDDEGDKKNEGDEVNEDREKDYG